MAKERILILIPAKGDSTRFKEKNIRMLGGKTLLAWTAEAARESGLGNRIVVSTEDDGVRGEALSLGLDVPFIRPAALARDPAGIVDVALHALDALEAKGELYDTLIILPPTCPLRNADDVRGAYSLFIDTKRAFVMTVSAFPHTPYAALNMDETGRLTPVLPEYFGRKSQEMPAAFRPNGAVHVVDVARFREARSYTAEPLFGYVMPRDRSVDIDTEQDLIEAEMLLSLRRNRSGAA